MRELKRIQPAVFKISTPDIPGTRSLKLDNGIPVFLIESGTEDVMRIDFTFKAGQIKEYLPLLAQATNLMLKEGSENYKSLEMNRLIDYYGSYINLYTEKDIAGLMIYLLNKHTEKLLELCREMLFRPVFPEDELAALMKKQVRWFQIRKKKVQNLAMDQFFESIFGKTHPYGIKPIETDFERKRSIMLRDFHSKYYRPENMAIIASGRFPVNIEKLLNSFFGNIRLSEVYIEEPGSILKSGRNKRVHIEHDGSVQTSIKIGSRTINKTDPDYPGLKIVDTILGGYFGSRLMKNIREEKGYTYGINSYATSLEESGYKVISTDVGIEHTQNAIDEIIKEIGLLQTVPVGKEELATAKNYLLGELVRMFDGPFASADSFKAAWEFGLDNNYYLGFFEKVKSISPDEIMNLTTKYYKIADLYIITAGTL